MKALFALTPHESKRLIAKGTASHPEIKRALTTSTVIVAGGITNGYVIEELTGEPLDKVHYTAGICMKGTYCTTPRDKRILPYVFSRGKRIDKSLDEAIEDRMPGTVFIKGANALDREGRAGVFMASPVGGTIGKALGTVQAMGFRLIVPVGLEKLIPSVEEAAKVLGIERIDTSLGAGVGLMPLIGAEVITELTALRILTGVEARVVGAGGIDGSEGQVVIACWGDDDDVEQALDVVNRLKGEAPLEGDRGDCQTCEYNCIWRGKGGARTIFY